MIIEIHDFRSARARQADGIGSVKLTVAAPKGPDLVLVIPVQVKNLHAVVVGVGHEYLVASDGDPGG